MCLKQTLYRTGSAELLRLARLARALQGWQRKGARSLCLERVHLTALPTLCRNLPEAGQSQANEDAFFSFQILIHQPE